MLNVTEKKYTATYWLRLQASTAMLCQSITVLCQTPRYAPCHWGRLDNINYITESDSTPVSSRYEARRDPSYSWDRPDGSHNIAKSDYTIAVTLLIEKRQYSTHCWVRLDGIHHTTEPDSTISTHCWVRLDDIYHTIHSVESKSKYASLGWTIYI
jgi:hypothetical protein